MTRRQFAWTAAAGAGAVATAAAVFRTLPAGPVLTLPVHRVVDKRSSADLTVFWNQIWPEAVRDLARCGVELRCTDAVGEMRRSPSAHPIFVGLRRGVLNLFLTDETPLAWSRGRGVAGVTTLHEGYHLCLIAVNHAHGHRIPFVAVNTCLHELLHAILLDILETRPKGWEAGLREFRIDWHATGLWLFGRGRTIRNSAADYLARVTTV